MNTTIPSLSEQVQQAFCQGDHDAWQRLTESVNERVRISIEFQLPTKVRAKESAEDILQKVLIKIWESRAKYDSQRCHYPVWLRRFADLEVIDTVRHYHAKRRTVKDEIEIIPNTAADQTVVSLAGILISPHTNPFQAITRNETRVRLIETINTLSPSDREVIRLHYLEQLTTEEMAQLLEMNEATVRKRTQRAFSRLQELIMKEKSKWGVSTHGLDH